MAVVKGMLARCRRDHRSQGYGRADAENLEAYKRDWGEPHMIEIEHLCKEYTRRAGPVLRDINLTFGTGVFGLLGPNGAGKSTLMHILATLATPSSGSARVRGHDIVGDRRAIRRILGFLPQDFGFYPHFTAFEILDYLALLGGLGHERHRRIEEVLTAVRLSDVTHQRVGTFSGGMKQRLGIAQALLNRPSVLIVDEPTSGLRSRSRGTRALSQYARRTGHAGHGYHLHAHRL